MKRQDVQVGVEYAETAPLAYGREPHTDPNKVRFTDTRPGPWAVVRTQQRSADNNRWEPIDAEIVNLRSTGGLAHRSLPDGLTEALKKRYGKPVTEERKSIGGEPRAVTRTQIDHTAPKPGDEVTYLDTSVKGGLPGERWEPRIQEWRPVLIAPSYIHREWSEVQAKQDRKANEAVMADKIAKVPEINEFLGMVGLGNLIRARRSTHGSRVTFGVAGPAGDGNGETVLRALCDWADDKGLLGLTVESKS